ncbi:MAG: hypothetical protein K1X75_05810 [Leptospirales bacterium]|nr:hypothetical protein [Leptospirales bacterium]
MLRLIWRQILRHKLALGLVALLWIGAGALVFGNRDAFFAWLSALFVNLPPPGEQRPEAAWSYFQRAEQRLQDEHIDLGIMERSCEDYLPRRFSGDVNRFRPDWLERLQHWKISGAEAGSGLESAIAQPDQYWQDNIAATLASLRDTVNAAQFAQEIAPDVHGQQQRGSILLAEQISRLGRAVCRPELALLAWGDYVAFQEERSWRKIVADLPEDAEREYGPGERSQKIAEALRGDALYVRALSEYAGGAPPDPHDSQSCSGPARYSLACAAPAEAVSVYERLLAAAPAERAPANHINAGLALLHLSQTSDDSTALRQRAVDHFAVAAADRQSEQEARLELADIYLSEDNVQSAYEELKALQLLARRPGFRQHDFRSLAARVLRRMGRLGDADCFSAMSDALSGTRTHCRNLQL